MMSRLEAQTDNEKAGGAVAAVVPGLDSVELAAGPPNAEHNCWQRG